MATRELRILPAALDELESAVRWYLRQSPIAAEKFVAEVDHAVDLISAHPMRWPKGKYSTRKLTLQRFPFAVVYRTLSECVEVLAFAHGHRRPGYWKERI
jgi:plasmid stabilization system protein ParE